MSNLQKIGNIFERMYGVVDHIEWFTNMGTDLSIFIDEIPIIYDFLNQRRGRQYWDRIDTTNDVHAIEISELRSHIRGEDVRLFKKTALQQRFNFFILLNLAEKNRTGIFTANFPNLVNFTDGEITQTFIDSSITLFRNFVQYDEEQRELYLSSIKIFNGFYVYLIWNLLDENEFLNIPLQNDGARSRINNININTMIDTYAKFCDRFFDHLDIDDVILIGYNLFNDELEFNNIENNHDVSVLEIKNIENNQGVSVLEIKNIENNQDLNMSEIKTIETNGSFVEEYEAVVGKNNNRTIDKDIFNTVFRRSFSETLKLESENISHLQFDDKNKIDIVFLEAAHIIPVSDIRTLYLDAKDKNNKILNDIIKLTRSTKNGVLIPFNYHKFFDKKYIELSKSKNKFILTKIGKDNVSTLERLGFKNCHSINKNKYDEIINTINEYDEMLRELKSINN